MGCTNSKVPTERTIQSNPAVDTTGGGDAFGSTSADHAIDHLPDEELHKLLVKSCKEGKIVLTKDILKRKHLNLDINYQIRNDGTLLFVASYHNHLEIVELIFNLYGSSVDVNITTNWSSHPLHPAAWNGSTALVERLLDAGGEINCQDRSQLTPLGYAAANGHFETAKLLVARNANLNMELEDNETALEFARKNGHDDIVTLLLDNGARERRSY